MIAHTLILSTPKIEIPKEGIILFIKELISSNLLNVNYFGVELDNQDDYRDEEMQSKFDNSTILIFHFEQQVIDYTLLSDDEIFINIVSLLDTNLQPNIIVDEKDIEVYFI